MRYPHPPHTGPAGRLNDAFHRAYEAAAAEARAPLGAEVPVGVVTGDELVLAFAGTTQAHALRGPRYHLAKAISHVPAALALAEDGGGLPRDALRAGIDALRGALEPPEMPGAREVLDEAAAALARPRRADLRRLGRATEPLLRAAAELELSALDRAMAASAERAGAAWPRARFVVLGGHQLRYKDLAARYLATYLGEPRGSGAQGERRLLYLEGGASIEEALDLLARHDVDRRLGAALFAEPEALQQHLLGDAAGDIVAAWFARSPDDVPT